MNDRDFSLHALSFARSVSRSQVAIKTNRQYSYSKLFWRFGESHVMLRLCQCPGSAAAKFSPAYICNRGSNRRKAHYMSAEHATRESAPQYYRRHEGKMFMVVIAWLQHGEGMDCSCN